MSAASDDYFKLATIEIAYRIARPGDDVDDKGAAGWGAEVVQDPVLKQMLTLLSQNP